MSESFENNERSNFSRKLKESRRLNFEISHLKSVATSTIAANFLAPKFPHARNGGRRSRVIRFRLIDDYHDGRLLSRHRPQSDEEEISATPLGSLAFSSRSETTTTMTSAPTMKEHRVPQLFPAVRQRFLFRGPWKPWRFTRHSIYSPTGRSLNEETTIIRRCVCACVPSRNRFEF